VGANPCSRPRRKLRGQGFHRIDRRRHLLRVDARVLGLLLQRSLAILKLKQLGFGICNGFLGICGSRMISSGHGSAQIGLQNVAFALQSLNCTVHKVQIALINLPLSLLGVPGSRFGPPFSL
jgi:hypothetical protein